MALRSPLPNPDDALRASPPVYVCAASSLELVSPVHSELDCQDAKAASPQHLRILVVEDNSVLRIATVGLLAAWGITPALAADGSEAVLLAAGGAYDIILMDLQMPGMGGIEAVYLIRKEERGRLSLERMPIIAYTSDADIDEAWLRTCGFDAVLQKPCSGRAMKTCLAYWCPSSFESNSD